MNINQLLRRRDEVNQRVQELAVMAALDAGISAEQKTEFATLKAEFASLSSDIELQQDAEKMKATQAVPVEQFAGQTQAATKPVVKDFKGGTFVKMAMCIGQAGGNLDQAATFAEKKLGDMTVMAALDTGASSGGVLVPEEKAKEVIELLEPTSVVRELGARSLPIVRDLSMPKVVGGSTAQYTGEGETIKSSTPTFGKVGLSLKKITSLVPMSNELMAMSDYGTQSLLLEDMLAGIGTTSDQKFIRSDGSSNTPTGLYHQAPPANKIPFAGNANLADIDAFLDLIMLALMSANSKMRRCGWAVAPRTWMTLSGLLNAHGNKVYPEMASGMLKGFPIKHTTSIPINLGAGSNESEIYFADFSDVIIGDDPSMTIDYSKEATYVDANGDLVSAFTNDESLIKVVTRNDLACRHNEAISVGTAVTW